MARMLRQTGDGEAGARREAATAATVALGLILGGALVAAFLPFVWPHLVAEFGGLPTDAYRTDIGWPWPYLFHVPPWTRGGDLVMRAGGPSVALHMPHQGDPLHFSAGAFGLDVLLWVAVLALPVVFKRRAVP